MEDIGNVGRYANTTNQEPSAYILDVLWVC